MFIRLMGATIFDIDIVDICTAGFIIGDIGFVHGCIGICIGFRDIIIFSSVIHKAL